MTVIEAIIIGLVQGLTEFLPVSSSGHILLVERILGVKSELSFTLIMHLATLLAVLIVMRKDAFAALKGDYKWKIVLATLLSFLVVVAISGAIKAALGGALLAVCFLFTAVILLLSGFFSPKKDKIGYFDAAIIGLAQGVAVMPGISRSGATVGTAIMLGNNKKEAVSFSFLLSVPIIIGSSLIDFLSEGIGSVEIVPLIFGFFTAFLSGLFAAKMMLRLTKASFDFFALYLTVLSIFLIINDLAIHLF